MERVPVNAKNRPLNEIKLTHVRALLVSYLFLGATCSNDRSNRWAPGTAPATTAICRDRASLYCV